MRSSIVTLLFTTVSLAAIPAYGSDLSFVLNPATEGGTPTNLNADADSCLPTNCALFTGVLTDNDTDESTISLNNFAINISLSFSSTPASGLLSIDNSFGDLVPGTLIGDPSSDFIPNSYSGPIFGIDIAPGTSVGSYSGVVTIIAAGGTNDPDFDGFTVTQPFTVVVAPEPAAATLLFAGLLPFAVWLGVRRQWRSSEVSR